jgi:hypothetical protein
LSRQFEADAASDTIQAVDAGRRGSNSEVALLGAAPTQLNVPSA